MFPDLEPISPLSPSADEQSAIEQPQRIPELSKGIDSWRKKNGYKCHYLSINRRKTYFEDPADRDTAYNREAALRGLGISDGSAESVTPRDHFDLAEIRKMAGSRSENLFEIFKIGLEQLPAVNMELQAARDEFIHEKKLAVEAGALKERSCDQQRHAVDALIKEAHFTQMSDVRNPPFKHWFWGRKLSPKGRHSFFKALGVFLNWAVEKRYLARNPFSEFEVPEPPPKRTVFTVAQTKHMLDVAQRKFPSLVPLLAIEFFAGVRPETAELLDYSDLDRRQGLIRLRVGKFAQGETEHVERFPDTLWHWLPKRRKGRIAPANYKNLITALHHELGYSKKKPWPQDVARHTFASHFAALTGSLEKLAFTLNHRRPATSLKYYRRRVPPSAGVAYFKQRPLKRVGNV